MEIHLLLSLLALLVSLNMSTLMTMSTSSPHQTPADSDGGNASASCCDMERSTLPLCARCCTPQHVVTLNWHMGYLFTCKPRAPGPCVPSGTVLVNSSVPGYSHVQQELSCCADSVMMLRFERLVQTNFNDSYFYHIAIGCS